VKIHLVETESFHADGQADMTKLIVDFRIFAKALTNNELRKMKIRRN